MTLRLSLASHFVYACALAQTPTKQDALGYPYLLITIQPAQVGVGSP